MNRPGGNRRIRIERSGAARVRRERARRFRRRNAPRPMHLTERDVEVLEALAVHRMLSGDQLRRLVFGCSGSRVRRRLRTLYDHGFVERISVTAQPARGIPPFVYELSAKGVEALGEIGVEAAKRGANGLSLQTVRHKLIVNDVYITLVEATRDTRYSVRGWRHEQDLKLTGEDGGGRGRAERVEHPTLEKPLSFLPDGYFELDLGDGTSFAFFVEVDLATHAQRVWRERAKLYTAYADPQAGLFRRRFGRETFRLAIVTTPDYRGRSRRNNILDSIGRTVGASPLFLAATLDDLQAERILGPVWKTPGRQRPVRLTDNIGGGGVVVRPRRRTVVRSGE